jgi:hypothetical protein
LTTGTTQPKAQGSEEPILEKIPPLLTQIPTREDPTLDEGGETEMEWDEKEFVEIDLVHLK